MLDIKMKVAVIVATAAKGVIGCNNQLPWRLPEDLKYFKSITLGKPIIMGRKTYESIGRPLPGRPNIVITRNPDWSADGVIVVSSVEAALAQAQQLVLETAGMLPEAMVIGGAEIYRSALILADRVYLTQIDLDVDGDAWFPALDERDWHLVSRQEGESGASLTHRFLVYERIA